MLSKIDDTEFGEPIFAGLYNGYEISVIIGEYAEISIDNITTNKKGNIIQTYPYATIYTKVCNNTKLETFIKSIIDNLETVKWVN